MIPTRKFPYTDFHDLNLDWILEKFNSYELDFEDLKRRIKILEDWREVIDDWREIIDIDIANIKFQINALKDDTLNLYITTTQGSPGMTGIKIGSIESDYITIDADFVNEIIRRIRNESEFGNNTINVYEYNLRPVHEGSKNYRRLNIRIIRVPGSSNKRYLLFETLERFYNTTGFSGNRLSYFCYRIEYEIDADEKATSIVSITNLYDSHQNCYVALHPKILEIKTTDNFEATGDADYPYRLKHDDTDYTNETSVAVYFATLNDFKTYSGIISEYVQGDYGCFYLYFKEIPAADFEMHYIIGG